MVIVLKLLMKIALPEIQAIKSSSHIVTHVCHQVMLLLFWAASCVPLPSYTADQLALSILRTFLAWNHDTLPLGASNDNVNKTECCQSAYLLRPLQNQLLLLRNKLSPAHWGQMSQRWQNSSSLDPTACLGSCHVKLRQQVNKDKVPMRWLHEYNTIEYTLTSP